jgi:hypothetical protein
VSAVNVRFQLEVAGPAPLSNCFIEFAGIHENVISLSKIAADESALSMGTKTDLTLIATE